MEMNFEELVNSESYHAHVLAAKNPNCPVHLLEKLADDKDRYVRLKVARNPNCPVHLLEKLVDDGTTYVYDSDTHTYWLVRPGVERNPNCPQYLKDYIKAKEFVLLNNHLDLLS
jgi:hypothetical protein